MLFYLISTKFKIRVANMLYQMTRLLGVSSARTIEREGIRYQVDLAEGIDLSLFLFGHFQKHVTHNNLFTLPKNCVVLDIGANFGVISLSLMNQYPSAIIYAFEPTDYAFKKLKINQQPLTFGFNALKSAIQLLPTVTTQRPKYITRETL